MNLILWRHTEAEDLSPDVSNWREADMQRALTARGHKQAKASADWLRRHAPADIRVLSSPAVRAKETAQALRAELEFDSALAPDADVSQVLAALGWPYGRDVIAVGHQPWLGRLASLLLAGSELSWSVKKSGIWWLTSREREGGMGLVLRAVINPEQLL
ncbi:MAG: histidine phosphatase family protein, partial [Candidatus Protistobacter heckmanni]|nr:histidine phosphatase family protein [Candidatus Protistobacter heckmanni]